MCWLCLNLIQSSSEATFGGSFSSRIKTLQPTFNKSFDRTRRLQQRFSPFGWIIQRTCNVWDGILLKATEGCTSMQKQKCVCSWIFMKYEVTLLSGQPYGWKKPNWRQETRVGWLNPFNKVVFPNKHWSNSFFSPFTEHLPWVYKT